MIVGSLFLVVVAGLLLALGLVNLDEPLLYSSIGTSILAALVLVVGVRRLAAIRAGQGAIVAAIAGPAIGRAVARVVRPVGRATVTPAVPTVAGALVLVVDDEPHYHRAGCAALAGLEAEEASLAEAVESGFTRCERCRP